MSEGMKRFRCHNICNKILRDLTLLNEKKIEHELFEFCGLNSQVWEGNIKDAIDYYYLETKHGFDISQGEI